MRPKWWIAWILGAFMGVLFTALIVFTFGITDLIRVSLIGLFCGVGFGWLGIEIAEKFK